MTSEKKQIFTRRVTQANRTQLAVVVYDIFLEYISDALNAHNEGDAEEFALSMQMAMECIYEMRSALDFKYALAKNLFAIYNYAERELAGNLFKNRTDNLEELKKMFTSLRDAYDTISKNDTSEPLMDNIQDIYAGFTYGKTDVNENLINYDAERGFRV